MSFCEEKGIDPALCDMGFFKVESIRIFQKGLSDIENNLIILYTSYTISIRFHNQENPLHDLDTIRYYPSLMIYHDSDILDI